MLKSRRRSSQRAADTWIDASLVQALIDIYRARGERLTVKEAFNAVCPNGDLATFQRVARVYRKFRRTGSPELFVWPEGRFEQTVARLSSKKSGNE